MNSSSGDSEKLFDEIQNAAKQGTHLPRGESISYRRTIPNYVILEEIHRGGQGVVFKAIQESTKRTVALKFILQGSFATERQRFRFEREIALASRLTHPNIVTVYDGGIANNQPFCAMEYIEGKRLSEYVIELIHSKRNVRQIVELFCRVCEAVGYAHTRGVVHRDLKPANILVDSAGQPHVLDFGLAKASEYESGGKFTLHTMSGEFVGTLAYASPEQAEANPKLTDARSDVYSLGVVLYELLTGRLPYDVTGSLAQTLNKISVADPIRPSKLCVSVDAELETVMLKSLDKDPARRYQNASCLADDLRRYLNGDPIDARGDSKWYVFRKLVVRYRRLLVAVGMFVAVLISSLISVSLFYLQAVRDRDLATKAKSEETRLREEAEFQSYTAYIAGADSSAQGYNTLDAIRSLSNAPKKHRSFEWWYLLGRVDLSESSLGAIENGSTSSDLGNYSSVDYQPGNDWLVSGNYRGLVSFWNTKTKQRLGSRDFSTQIRSVRVHPDGKHVAVGLSDGNARLLKITDQAEFRITCVLDSREFPSDGQQINSIEFSPDGKLLLIAAGTSPKPGAVYVYEFETANLMRKLEGFQSLACAVAISSEGTYVASGDTGIRVWNLESGELVREFPGHDNWIRDLAFRPNSMQLASSANEPEIKIWDVESGQKLTSLFGHSSFVNSIQYSPDGQLLASGSEDRTLRFWNADSFRSVATKWGHIGGISELDFSPDGALVATAGSLCLKTWTPDSVAETSFGTGIYQQIVDVEIGPDSKRLLASDNLGRLVEWDLPTRKPVRQLARAAVPPSAVRGIAWSRNGRYVAWANDDENVYLRDDTTRKKKVLRGHDEAVTSVAFSADENDLYSCSTDKSVRKWDIAAESSSVLFQSDQPVHKVLASRDGRWIVIAVEGSIVILDPITGRQINSWERKRGVNAENFDMAIHPDGSMVAAPIDDSYTGVWAIPSGEELAKLGEHTQQVFAVDFSPDGKRIGSSSSDGTIKLWDCERFQPVLTLRGHTGYCKTIAFAPDNSALVGGMYGGTVNVWKTLDHSRRRPDERP